MSVDQFRASSDSLIAPARQCFSITPNDIENLAQLPKALYIGQGGQITLRAVDSSNDVTFVNIASGTVLDVRVSAVRASGTTASALIGLA